MHNFPKPDKDGWFTCEKCGERFQSDEKDEDVLARFKKEIGAKFINEEMIALCDDCYGQFMIWWKKNKSKY